MGMTLAKILLYTIGGFAMIVADLLFIPGGFIIAIGSVVILYAVYITYGEFGIWWALIHLGTCLALVPKLVTTSLGRVALREEMTADRGFVGIDEHNHLIGRQGRAHTDLRPSGMLAIEIDGREEHLDCIAEGGYITKGEPVVVTEERGPSLVVRRASEGVA
ncbi:MAG: NfeD family protein [Acidobacteriota bacterium]|nr:NfeD family protein [Acidobacteriota bacterium]